jgi:hypothetical protein
LLFLFAWYYWIGFFLVFLDTLCWVVLSGGSPNPRTYCRVSSNNASLCPISFFSNYQTVHLDAFEAGSSEACRNLCHAF